MLPSAAIKKYREAMDALYNFNETVRKAVIQTFGLKHPEVDWSNRFEYRVVFIPIPPELEIESDAYNVHLEKQLNMMGQMGWECFQSNGIRYGDNLRVHFKRRIL